MEWLTAKLLNSAIGSILQPIIGGFLTYKKQELDAVGSHEAQVAAVTIQAQKNDVREAELNSRQNQIDSERGGWFVRLPRPLMGNSAGVLVAKLLVWDLAFGQWTGGHTDKLSEQTMWILTTIIVAYFGGRTVETVATKISNALTKNK